MPTSSIFKVFARSPFGPLQEHMEVVKACVAELIPFFKAAQSDEWKHAETIQHSIAELENKADEVKRDMRMHLPKGLFMPVSRTDVLALVSVQDSLANKARDIAGVVLGRKMQLPATLAEKFTAFLHRSVDATVQASQAIQELEELQETGFSGKEVEIVERMIDILADIEHETDEMQIHIRCQLFQIEKELPPIDVIFLYKIIEWVGDLADNAQNVGDRLQLLMAK